MKKSALKLDNKSAQDIVLDAVYLQMKNCEQMYIKWDRDDLLRCEDRYASIEVFQTTDVPTIARINEVTKHDGYITVSVLFERPYYKYNRIIHGKKILLYGMDIAFTVTKTPQSDELNSIEFEWSIPFTIHKPSTIIDEL